MSLKTILNLCNTHGYLTPVNKTVQDFYKIGSTGALLLENLKAEWKNNMVINPSASVFYNTNIFQNSYQYAKDLCLEYLPFGIAETVDEQINMYKDFSAKEDKNSVKLLLPFSKEVLLCTMFLSPTESTEFFHKWQIQRRMWWRKLAASPGRYYLTEINSNTLGDSVQIFAKYPWGDQLVESIHLSDKNHPCLSIEDMIVKDGKKKVKPHFLVSQVSLPTMLMNTICDAYEELKFNDKTRPVLRLHRKICPYKISFAISSPSKLPDLRDLAQYLCNLLRAKNISCLYVPTSFKKTLDAQWSHYDQLGVPYSVLLNETTLKNGVLNLRSRETTLSEQVHVSKLVDYVEQLFKNY